MKTSSSLRWALLGQALLIALVTASWAAPDDARDAQRTGLVNCITCDLPVRTFTDYTA